MLCVMHVKDGNEERAEQLIGDLLEDDTVEECFHLTRLRRKKFGGEWRTITETLLPGYVFIATEKPERLYRELKKARGYAGGAAESGGRQDRVSENGGKYRLLGSSEEYVAALESGETDFIEKIAGKGKRTGEIGLSFLKENEDGRVTVLSGPLLSVKERVRKIDFHRRIAEVETEFLGEARRVYLGVEFEDRL